MVLLCSSSSPSSLTSSLTSSSSRKRRRELMKVTRYLRTTRTDEREKIVFLNFFFRLFLLLHSFWLSNNLSRHQNTLSKYSLSERRRRERVYNNGKKRGI